MMVPRARAIAVLFLLASPIFLGEVHADVIVAPAGSVLNTVDNPKTEGDEGGRFVIKVDSILAPDPVFMRAIAADRVKEKTTEAWANCEADLTAAKRPEIGIFRTAGMLTVGAIAGAIVTFLVVR